MNTDGPTSESGSLFAPIAACVVAVLGILFPLPSFVELYGIAPGSSIRPMGQFAAMLVAGIGTPLFVILLAWPSARRRGRCRVLSIVAIALSFVPLPAYYLAFQWLVRVHNLDLKP